MNPEEAITQAEELVQRAQTAMLATLDGQGYPNVRAMLKMEHEGLATIWFSTNASSRKVAQVSADPRACVYFVDHERWMGLMLVGEAEVLRDLESKERLWREGFNMYYPQGVSDPDYAVLRFHARRGEFYHRLQVVPFEL